MIQGVFMKKYLLVLMVVVLSLSAQTTTPQLDSPQQVYTGNLHFMSITVTGNYFSNFTIANIIQLLSGMSKAGHTSGVAGNWWNMGWADQTDYNNAMAGLIKELQAYYNSFPASSEVLSASLNNGQTVYATSFGEVIGGEAKSNISVQQDYGQGGGVVTVNGIQYDADDIDTKDNTKEQQIRLSTNPNATLHTEYVYNGQKITEEDYNAYQKAYEDAQKAYEDAKANQQTTANELASLQETLTSAETKLAEVEAATKALNEANDAAEAAQNALTNAQNDKNNKDELAKVAQNALTNAQNALTNAQNAAQEATKALENATDSDDIDSLTVAKEAAEKAAQEATEALEAATKALNEANDAAEAAQNALTNAQNDKEATENVAKEAAKALEQQGMTLEQAKEAKETAQTNVANANADNETAINNLNTASDLQSSTQKQVEKWEKNEYNTYSATDKNGNIVATDAQGYQINEDGSRATETVKDGTQTVYVRDETSETGWKVLTVLQENETKINKNNINAGSNSYVDNQTGKTIYMSNVLSNSVTKYETDANKVNESTTTQQSLYDAEVGNDNSTQTLTFYAGRNSTSYVNNGAWDLGSNASVTKAQAKSVLTIKTNSGKTYNIQAYSTTTPLVLDMDGDGKLEASKGQHLPHELATDPANMVNFDINGDGFDELVEWVGPNDGLLVRYTEGEEMTGLNLFGSATGFQDGYQSLSVLDANKDNVISGAELEGLSVWQDANGNAKVDAGEIKTVQALGITAINVTHIGLKSSFQRDGKYATMWDWHPCTIVVRKMD
jgi:predicted  nucleic acid-binding Zn-ribbon protein